MMSKFILSFLMFISSSVLFADSSSVTTFLMTAEIEGFVSLEDTIALETDSFVTEDGQDCMKNSRVFSTEGEITLLNRVKSPNSSAESIHLNSKNKFVKWFDEYNVEIKDPMLESYTKVLTAKGLESGQKYKLVWQLTSTRAILNKLVENDDISTDERPYSCRNKNEESTWLVPLGGFNVTLWSKEQIINPDNDQQIYVWMQNANIADATHVRYHQENLQAFKAQSKRDFFPKGYFEGRWGFSTSTSDGETKSSSSSQNQSVHIRAGKNYLFVFGEPDLRQEKEDPLMKIPLSSKTFMREKSISSLSLPAVGMQEAVWPDSPGKYIELDFANVQSVYDADDLFKARNVKELKVDDNHFSFEIQNLESKGVIRYSFSRE